MVAAEALGVVAFHAVEQAADKVVTVGSDVFVLSDVSAVVNNGSRVDVYLKGGQIVNVSAATAGRVRDALLKLHGGK